MRRIEVREIDDLRSHAERVYELGQGSPTPELDGAVEQLITRLDEVCDLLEVHGRGAAERRETVAVEGLHEALRMTDAAIGAIDSAGRNSGWEFRGTPRSPRERSRDDINMEGLWTLKSRFNNLMMQLRHERIRSIVRRTLVAHFADEFVFEPILVVPTADEFGEGDGGTYLRILVVFKGDQRRLDPAWTSRFVRHIQPKLIEAGVEEFPSVSFIEKSEWWRSFHQWTKRHPDALQFVEFPPPIAMRPAGSG